MTGTETCNIRKGWIMFGTHNLGIFLFACIALNLIPGQDTLYILGRSISQGRVAGIVSVFGVGSGCVVHILAAAIGFYSLLALSPIAFTAICMAGGLYLIYLGIMTIIGSKTARPAFTTRDTRQSKWEIYRQGVLTNLLNPKVALFFIAFLPQFIDPVSNLGSISFLFLGVIFLCTGTIWCMFVAISASAIADNYRDNPKIQRGFDYFTCILFVGLGIGIL
ncbi:MAG: LysE family translocator, partial [Methanoregula sp.]|nr:LysE family translocator [Methanoregula sp.]